MVEHGGSRVDAAASQAALPACPSGAHDAEAVDGLYAEQAARCLLVHGIGGAYSAGRCSRPQPRKQLRDQGIRLRPARKGEQRRPALARPCTRRGSCRIQVLSPLQNPAMILSEGRSRRAQRLD